MKTFKEFIHEATKTHEPTTTANKVDVIEKENQFIKKYNTGDGKLYGVVGHPEGFERHIRQYHALGYPVNDITIFEIDGDTYESLKPKADLYKVKLVHGSILQPDSQVTHIDFDVTSDTKNFRSDLDTILKIFPNIKTGVLVYSKSRRAVSEFPFPESRKILDELNIDKTKISNLKGYYDLLTSGMSKRDKQMIDTITDNSQLTFKVKPYTGKGNWNMISIAFAKVPGNNKAEFDNITSKSSQSQRQQKSQGLAAFDVLMKFKVDDWKKHIESFRLLDLNWKKFDKERKQLAKVFKT